MTGLGEWDDQPDLDDVGAGPGEPLAELCFPTLKAFVEQQLAPIWRRNLSGNALTWCPEWGATPKRSRASRRLWRAWEHLRLDPALGMSVWVRDHADHHMAVLLGADGPFKGRSPEEGKGHSPRLTALPCTPPPPGLFDTP